MGDEKNACCQDPKHWKHRQMQGGATGGALYGLGLIGAVIFFIGKATTFWLGVLAILKAFVWPAILVYELLKFLIK